MVYIRLKSLNYTTEVFRWFKFTLKPPNSVTHGNLLWAIRTLPIGIFLSNLDSRQLDTSLMTSYGHFWHMSTFGDSRPFEYFCQNMGASENQSFLDEGAIGVDEAWGFRWADNWATWWYHFFGGATHLRGAGGRRKKIGIFQDICDGLKGTQNWSIGPRISP